MSLGYVKFAKKGFTQSKITVSSDADFLKDELLIKITESYILFEKPSFDYKGKTNKLTKSYNLYHTSVTTLIDDRIIHFDDEESTDEYLIAYF